MHIDAKIWALYDRYRHSGMSRRAFLGRASALCAGGVGMAVALPPDYARACQIAFTDPRMMAGYVRFPSPGGNGPESRAYVARPVG